ncbi:hypothetical protein DH2020_012743 [Rehmannia glutinosa]|uniref:GDSL esterase/lipase n=1 Tax=Rehmannia glutinosa TaxID=99300 RepID=A0ABR0X3F6_REHGL
MMELIMILVLWPFFLSTITTNAEEMINSPPCDYTAVYNFGDSNSDTGGIAAAFYPPASPSGETYFHRPAGRASDGRLIIDFIAKDECIRKRLPKPDQDLGKALFTIDIGQNDVAFGIRTLSFELQKAAVPNIVSQFISQVRVLNERGARTFWIHNTGPIGCLPVATAKVKDPVAGYLDEIGCVKYQNDVALLFNKVLKEEIVKLRSELTYAAIVYVDMYAAKYELISHAKNQGFEDPFTTCCGYHGIDYDVYCGNKGVVNGSEVIAGSCPNPSKLISWDGVHYTEAANQWIAIRILNGSLSDPTIAISRACHK